jgi:hypothetical protein
VTYHIFNVYIFSLNGVHLLKLQLHPQPNKLQVKLLVTYPIPRMIPMHQRSKALPHQTAIQAAQQLLEANSAPVVEGEVRQMINFWRHFRITAHT